MNAVVSRRIYNENKKFIKTADAYISDRDFATYQNVKEILFMQDILINGEQFIKAKGGDAVNNKDFLEILIKEVRLLDVYSNYKKIRENDDDVAEDVLLAFESAVIKQNKK